MSMDIFLRTQVVEVKLGLCCTVVDYWEDHNRCEVIRRRKDYQKLLFPTTKSCQVDTMVAERQTFIERKLEKQKKKVDNWRDICVRLHESWPRFRDLGIKSALLLGDFVVEPLVGVSLDIWSQRFLCHMTSLQKHSINNDDLPNIIINLSFW